MNTRVFCDLCDKPATPWPRKHMVFSRSDIDWSEPGIPKTQEAYTRFEHGSTMEITAAFNLKTQGNSTDVDLCPACARLLLGKLIATE